MQTIAAKELLETWVVFQHLRQLAGSRRKKKTDAAQRDLLVTVLCKLNGHCNYLGLRTSAELSKNQLAWLQDPANHRKWKRNGRYTMPKTPPLPDFESVFKALQDIGAAIDKELSPIHFPAVPHERSKFLYQERLFGEKVFLKFPDARADIQNAGSCVALGLSNAAAFHLMCIVERGLRKLANDLGVTTIKPNLPIEKGTWGEVIDKLQGAVTASAARTNPVGSARLVLCSEILVESRAIAQVWRNSVMHTRVDYNSQEVEHIFQHVKRFMNTLAEL